MSNLVETFGDDKLTAWEMGFAAYACAGLTLSDNPFPLQVDMPTIHGAAVGWPPRMSTTIHRIFQERISYEMPFQGHFEVIAVCSARPRPSVQKGAKGNHWWKRDVYHLRRQETARTYCGRDCSEWLVIGEIAETTSDCCALCIVNAGEAA
jgi:hypothetical protein